METAVCHKWHVQWCERGAKAPLLDFTPPRESACRAGLRAHAKKIAKKWRIVLDVPFCFCRISPTPLYPGQPEKAAAVRATTTATRPGEAVFQDTDFPWRPWPPRGRPPALDPNRIETLPGGGAGEEKGRKGKGRDACRGLRRDASIRGSGAGVTRHCQKVRKKILMVQQFLQNILWRV